MASNDNKLKINFRSRGSKRLLFKYILLDIWPEKGNDLIIGV